MAGLSRPVYPPMRMTSLIIKEQIAMQQAIYDHLRVINSCSSPRRRSSIWQKLNSWGPNCPIYLTKKGSNIRKLWKDVVHGEAVGKLKEALTSSPELRLFALMPARRGLLQPDDNGDWHPIEYFSTTLSDNKRNYSATELECKALHDSLVHWHIFGESL